MSATIMNNKTPPTEEALTAALRWFENDLPGVMAEMGCPDENPWLFDPAWVAQARAALPAPAEPAALAVVPPPPSAEARFDAAMRAVIEAGCVNAVRIATSLGSLIAKQIDDAVRTRKGDPYKVEPLVLNAIDATIGMLRSAKGLAKSP